MTPTSTVEAESRTLIGDLAELRHFLSGEGALDGFTFGEWDAAAKTRAGRGHFWWRKHLSRIDAAITALRTPPTPTGGGGADLRASMRDAASKLSAWQDEHHDCDCRAGTSCGCVELREIRQALEVEAMTDAELSPAAPSQPHGGAGAGGWVLVPAEITRPMRHATWKADYLDAGATEAEAAVLAANREADPEEVEDANAAYRAMLAARPSPPPAAGPTQEAVEDGLPADWGSPKEWFAHIYRFKDRLDSLTDERNFPAHLLDAVQEIDMLLDEVIAAAPESLLALFNGAGR